MNQSPTPSSNSSHDPLEELRHHLDRALTLMDELQPASISAARLQLIVDELDQNFASTS